MTTADTIDAVRPHLLTPLVYAVYARPGGARVEVWDMDADQVEDVYEVTGPRPGQLAAEEFASRVGIAGREWFDIDRDYRIGG